MAKNKSKFAVFSELVKARLSLLVLLTTGVGFYAGSGEHVNWVRLTHSVLSTALLAAGAAALNEWWERKWDALMVRTRERPLPSGRVRPETAVVLGALFSVGGLLYACFAVNLVAGALGALTLGLYVLVYTPLKRVTTFNTALGAIPGALPPLIGWAGAVGSVTVPGWTLFAIQFFWQLPHFLAISWLYREDYARAGFKMLAVMDDSGLRTSLHATSHTLGLCAVSLGPFVLGIVGRWYVLAALVLGFGFAAFAARFAFRRTREHARALFFASLLYLPLIQGFVVLDKVK